MSRVNIAGCALAIACATSMAIGDEGVPGGITGVVFVQEDSPDRAWVPLAEAAVIVEAAPGESAVATMSGELILDERGLHPLIQALNPGGSVRLVSRSSSIHRIMAMAPDGTRLFSVALTVPGIEVAKTLRVDGLQTIVCAEPKHDREIAYVYVTPHVASALTDDAGRFLVQGIPPGVWSIVAVHPMIGSVKDSVTVVAARAAERNLYLVRIDLPPTETSPNRP